MFRSQVCNQRSDALQQGADGRQDKSQYKGQAGRLKCPDLGQNGHKLHEWHLYAEAARELFRQSSSDVFLYV